VQRHISYDGVSTQSFLDLRVVPSNRVYALATEQSRQKERHSQRLGSTDQSIGAYGTLLYHLFLEMGVLP
jgi:hypothetical protein